MVFGGPGFILTLHVPFVGSSNFTSIFSIVVVASEIKAKAAAERMKTKNFMLAIEHHRRLRLF